MPDVLRDALKSVDGMCLAMLREGVERGPVRAFIANVRRHVRATLAATVPAEPCLRLTEDDCPGRYADRDDWCVPCLARVPAVPVDIAAICRAKGDECAAETGGNTPTDVRLAFEGGCYNTARRIATALGDPITEPALDCDGGPMPDDEESR